MNSSALSQSDCALWYCILEACSVSSVSVLLSTLHRDEVVQFVEPHRNHVPERIAFAWLTPSSPRLTLRPALLYSSLRDTPVASLTRQPLELSLATCWNISLVVPV